MRSSSSLGHRHLPPLSHPKLVAPFLVAADESGTGVGHQAPAFGEDDYRVCMAHGIVDKGQALPCPVDYDGRFTAEAVDYAGM